MNLATGPLPNFPSMASHLRVYDGQENTEWQRPHSGVHSIMMEIPAQAVEGGPPPFTTYMYYHLQSCGVRSS
jgi:hypothetical protein